MCVCMYVSKFLWILYLKNQCAKIDETLYLVTPWYNLVLIRFWCILLKKFHCCSKFLISLTQQYRAKLRAIAPNSNYFTPIIFKFKIIIYNNSSNAIYNFCLYVWGQYSPHRGRGVTLRRNFLPLVFLERASQNMQN